MTGKDFKKIKRENGIMYLPDLTYRRHTWKDQARQWLSQIINAKAYRDDKVMQRLYLDNYYYCMEKAKGDAK